MADMAAPPTPMTWTAERASQVDLRPGHAARRGRRWRRRRRAGPGWPAPRPWRPAGPGVVEEGVELGGQALGGQLGVGDQHGAAGVGEPPGVAGLVVAGDERRRHQHDGQPDGGDLEAHRRARPEHADVGGGERRRHVGLVLHLLVDEPRPGRRRRRRDRLPVPAADDVADGDVVRSAHAPGQRDGGVVDRAGAERAAGDEHDPPVAAAGRGRSRAAAMPAGERSTASDLGADRVAGDHRPGQRRARERRRRSPGRSGPRSGWPRRGACSARRRRSAPATRTAAATHGNDA